MTPAESPASLFAAILVVAADGDPDLRHAQIVLLGQLTLDVARRFADEPKAVVDDLVACMQPRLTAAFDDWQDRTRN